jgi:hypothetical protein
MAARRYSAAGMLDDVGAVVRMPIPGALRKYVPLASPSPRSFAPNRDVLFSDPAPEFRLLLNNNVRYASPYEFRELWPSN